MSITINGQEIEIKPCPFCGSEDIIHMLDSLTEDSMECIGCLASGPRKTTTIEAIEAWNGRKG